MVALGRSVVEVEAVVRWWHGRGSVLLDGGMVEAVVATKELCGAQLSCEDTGLLLDSVCTPVMVLMGFGHPPIARVYTVLHPSHDFNGFSLQKCFWTPSHCTRFALGLQPTHVLDTLTLYWHLSRPYPVV